MAARAIALSGLAAFGLGLLGLSGLFHEPDGGPAGDRRAVQAAGTEQRWGSWQSSEPGAAPTITTEASQEAAEEAAMAAGVPLPHVWATPARWSEED